MRGFAAAVVCSSMVLVGCGAEDGAQPGEELRDEDLGTATFQLMAVPSGVGCLRISVSGTTSVSRDFGNLMSGASTTSLSMNRLPLGTVTIGGLAYATTCGAGDPLYIADTSSAVLAAGVVSELPLTFRKNNPVTANVNFVGNVQALSASGFQTSAIIDGATYSWGEAFAAVPTRIVSISNPLGLSSGSVARGWCFLREQGHLTCVGANSGNMFAPGGGWIFLGGVGYGGPGEYTGAAIGDKAMCAMSQGNKLLYCSGNNAAGQLGTDVPAAGTSTPVLTWWNGVASLTAGAEHFCLVDGALQVQCIGKNDSGQLGDGTTMNRSSWTNVLRGASVVSAGASHTCALQTDGSVKCWGSNPLGQLGDGTTTTRLTPVTVTGIAGATKLAAGAAHNCVLLGDGSVKCWGSNANGSLGDGTVKDRLAPVTVPLPEAAVDVSAGYAHTCVLTKRQDLYCWGDNSASQLGNGTYTNSTKPVRVVMP